MFGTKIRSWMEAHLARSRAKRNNNNNNNNSCREQQQQQQRGRQPIQSSDFAPQTHFDPAFFGARADLNEILPALAISSFKPELRQQQQQRDFVGNGTQRRHPPPPAPSAPVKSNGNNQNNNKRPLPPPRRYDHHQQQQQQQPQQQQQAGVVGSAVNLSSPESAYSTGYSTDGTSPCATYAPEYYINVRQQQQKQQYYRNQQNGLDGTTQTQTQTRSRTRILEERTTVKELARQKSGDREIDGTGTYTVVTRANGRNYAEQKQQQQRDSAYEEPPQLPPQQQQLQQQQNPWRKPAPPTSSRPLGSPKPAILHSPSHHHHQLTTRKPYSSSCSSPVPTAMPASSYPLQLFSPRRMPMVATTTTQVMPVKSPRQRSRLRTNPWPVAAATAMMQVQVQPGNPRAWTRQSYDYCCRQESLSVGRSPVNRSDWRMAHHYHQQQQQQQKQHQTNGTNRANGRRTRRNSSASSCSSCSRSRSCSLSSISRSNSSPSNASSCCSSDEDEDDDITLNEVMGKYEDSNYGYDKETDIVSDHSDNEHRSSNNNSSSANFSSDASASSLDLLQHLDCSSGRSTTTTTTRSRSRQMQRAMSARRHQRRRRQRRVSLDSRDEPAFEEEERREEVEVLQDILNRRLKKNKSEVSAQTNRALLERLLMKNSGFEGRRAWSANPPMPRTAASRSLGGTPICLRRRTSPRHVFSPPSRLNNMFGRHHQVYPAENPISSKKMSASELALIEADKEADLKYAQLIMEAEQMLLSAKEQLEREEESIASDSRRGSSASVTADNCSSPTRFPASRRAYQQQQQPQQQQQTQCTGIAPNKRVELIKNAELNIEFALSKSRNSQPELSSGSIKDLLDHSSPKRLLQKQQKKSIEPIVIHALTSTFNTEYDAMDFKSLDINEPIAMPRSSGILGTELSSSVATSEQYSCPQSEPVKRKVYEPHSEAGMLLQHQPPPWLRSSDTDCASEQPQLQSASAASSYAQLRKHMLIETLQSLKQSLEDQSAALKMNCLRPL